MRRLFGTDGIRGVANNDPMTCEMALKVGRAAGHIFQRDDRRHRILIGKDTRLSCYMLENALAAGICSMGVDVLLVGPLPTPAVAFMTRSVRADAGIVISASHNPYEDNGIKFFSNDGLKLPDEMEMEMENLIATGDIDNIRPTAGHIGKAFRIDDAVGRYNEFVKRSFPKGMMLDGLKVVVDCANGAAYKVGPQVLQELGATVTAINVNPDGVNINLNCGSVHPEQMQSTVTELGADVGMAFDGDADRVILADEKGDLADGDTIMAICALNMLRQNSLAANTLVTTIMSNMGLDYALSQEGGTVIRTHVGDRYVAEKMLENGYNLGGEQSGHILFMDHNTTGDGMITALQVLAIMRDEGASLSELAKCMVLFPQVKVNVRVREKPPIESLPGVQSTIAEAERALGHEGRILVRYSGTEPVARIMIEGRDGTELSRHADSVAAALREAVG